MSTLFERGPLSTFEITWNLGHVETIQAHQCLLPDLTGPRGPEEQWIVFHAEVAGNWQLVLAVRERDIRSVRDITTAETVPGEESA